tara:strand:- start:348 stop:1349 length:1002 start_codon:yes stop_codon:yes gene_type:complete
MKVSTVNLVCWCASGVFVLGLFGFALQHKGRLNKTLEDVPVAELVLNQPNDAKGPEGKRSDYQKEVVPIWHTLNWTGYVPPVKEKPPEGPKPTVVRKGVKDLLAIVFIQVDTDDPGGSVIRVRYQGDLAKEGDGQLVVGDTLPGRFSYAAVHRINPESVEFAFTIEEGKEEARENEVVDAFNDSSRYQIVSVVDGQVVRPPRKGLPQRADKPKAKTETREITPNLWQLGSEDVKSFGDDYQRILTQDVKTRTHYDANGKRAGIEITEVKSGSIAQRHGAKEGDIIISINGHGVSSEQEAIKYVKNNSDTTSVWEVVVENMGRRSTRVYRSPED